MSQPSQWIARVVQFVEHDVWHPVDTARRSVRWGQSGLQGLIAVVEGFRQSQVPLRASALTYYTVLSLVPLLSIVAAIVGAIGVDDLLPRLLEPIAQISREMADMIIGVVTRFDFGRLGTLGAVMLFLTTVLGVSSVERALNAVWGVDRERPWRRRLPDYLAVIVIAPLLLGAALSLNTALSSQDLVTQLRGYEVFNTFYDAGLRAAPLLFYWLGFSFMFWFMPNTHVRMESAALGGAVAALTFVVSNWIYVTFQVGAARANAVFGSVAAFPITVIWIYFSWILFLFGAECAYVHQNLGRLRRARIGKLPGAASLETIGLAVAAHVAHAFVERGQAITVEQIAQDLELQERVIRSVLGDLESAGILVLRGDPREAAYQPGRAPERVTVEDVLRALRGERDPEASLGTLRAEVLPVLHDLDEKGAAALAGRTLADLARPPRGALR